MDEKSEIVSDIVETVLTTPETTTEVDSQIAVAKMEDAVHRAENAVDIIEQTANLAIAQATIEAEQQIEKHEETVQALEYDAKWQQDQITQLWAKMDQILLMVSQLSTPTVSTTEATLPTTVEVIAETPPQNEDENQEAMQGNQETVLDELVEIVAPIKRKIKAL